MNYDVGAVEFYNITFRQANKTLSQLYRIVDMIHFHLDTCFEKSKRSTTIYRNSIVIVAAEVDTVTPKSCQYDIVIDDREIYIQTTDTSNSNEQHSSLNEQLDKDRLEEHVEEILINFII